MTIHVFFASLDPRSVLPARATDGSFGYDLTTIADQDVPPGPPVLLRTGLALAEDLPEGLALQILPRSSLYKNFQLTIPNAPGLVDRDYSGELYVQVLNQTDQPVEVPAGTRVAQALFVRVATPLLVVSPANPARNRGGFGSTGR